eukprot:TRINITY_DN21079_c0_g1_i1.p1 TRINITY_DN21079_c0_g1~~TRINITY_DN21079_c0_g1_i1.p1  ORF type:complete len:614 (+),score=117.15 TRINITY_DN21079_c0_g1_i1:31-1872(+)
MEAPQLDMTPTARSRYATSGLWCFERQFEGQDQKPPVRLVIFDFDETLTLSSFHPLQIQEYLRDLNFSAEWLGGVAATSLETPVESSRIEHLRKMFAELLKEDEAVEGRVLAVLTRSETGVAGCVNMLKGAEMDKYFSAVWGMSRKGVSEDVRAGVYRDGSFWKYFDAPFEKVPDHKANVLHDIAANPGDWFPQLAESSAMQSLLQSLQPENIVLVDDVRSNFRSSGGQAKLVYRCCKVARYDVDDFKGMGALKNMGGLGAHNKDDYSKLVNFVKTPWAYQAEQTASCVERPFMGMDDRPPSRLVIVEFDGALTLSSFLPEDSRSRSQIGCLGDEDEQRVLVDYNFESPYVQGSRVEKLKQLLCDLTHDPETGEKRVLAVLTMNEAGAIAILNLLMMAGLDEHLSSVWSLSVTESRADGVFKQENMWSACPSSPSPKSKLEALQNIVQEPETWFPQLKGERDTVEKLVLQGLSLANIVLVDDERENGQTPQDDMGPHRHCRVASYDDEYRDQGLLFRLGGVGAKSHEDYIKLLAFVREPWKFRATPSAKKLEPFDFDDAFPARSNSAPVPRLVRCPTESDSDVLNRSRSLSSLSELKKATSSYADFAKVLKTV